MSAPSWTPAQRSAIDTRDCTLLVSAAAGSGKTATLTRRIIERMSEDETLGDIAIGMNFSSQNYLTDFFRRHTGVPPSRYFKG